MWFPALASSKVTKTSVLRSLSSGGSTRASHRSPDRAVVHRVAHVRDDQREVRERVFAEVDAQLREGNDPFTSPWVGGDVAEVDERIVFLCVAPGPRAGEA